MTLSSDATKQRGARLRLRRAHLERLCRRRGTAGHGAHVPTVRGIAPCASCAEVMRRLWLDRDDQWYHVMTYNRYVAAAEFKLRLMDEVAQQRRPIIITKWGKPVAKLVPVETEAIDLFGRMAGSIKICGDIISPIEDAGWTGDDENI